MRPLPRSLLALSLAGLVASTLSACSPAIPDPQPTAQAVAAALESGDFSAVLLTDTEPAEVAKSLETAFGPMGELPRTHSVSDVAVDEDSGDGPETATATIHTVWDIDQSDTDLSYDTSAILEWDAEAEQWKLRFTPQLLAPELTEGQYLALRSESAQRGEILGAKDQVLVTNRPVVRLGIDKTRAESGQWEDAARELAELVEIDAEAFAQRVAGAGEKAWVEAIVLRDDADREVTDQQLGQIPGAVAQPDSLPLAPTRGFARPLLGTVGQATAEIIEKSEGRIKAGDQVGLSGLQASHNEALAGMAGSTVTRNSAQHEPVAELYSSAPVDGQDLHLSLDLEIQQEAEQLVADSDSPSSLVVLRPSDGMVLAAASGPESNSYNTALLGRYAPGSAFKVVSALAMLRAGDTPQSTVQCPATTTVEGKSFKNFDAYPKSALGAIPLSEAIAQSCNTVFVDAGAKVGAQALAEAGAALGVTGEDSTGAGAFLGSVPGESSGTELAANMIGQGVVQASPLGMATIAASIAAGTTVQPQLVLTEEPASPPATQGELSAAEAKDLAVMLAEVVDHGTLSDLRSVPGEKIIGKSGTAEYDDEQNAHAWTIAAQGDLAVAAFVEDGQGGAQTAGPLVAKLLTNLQK